MFERFTERARQVVVLAQEEAKANLYDHIGTGHVLLGVLREEEGLGARVLERYGVTIEKARELLLSYEPPTLEKPMDGQVPFTSDGKKSLELALREALALGHNYIGTEHILLGLIREAESNTGSPVGEILREYVGAAQQERWGWVFREEVVRMLTNAKDRRAGVKEVKKPEGPKPPEPLSSRIQFQTFDKTPENPFGQEEQVVFPCNVEKEREQVAFVEERNGVEVFVFASSKEGPFTVINAQEHVDMLLELLGRHRSRRVSTADAHEYKLEGSE